MEDIGHQFALFSMPSSARASLDDWLALHPQLARKILVPSSLKWEVRDKLDQANITERVLFRGLDGLGRWLARYYMPPTDRVGNEPARRGGTDAESHPATR